METRFITLCRQLDIACQNRDLPAARRISRKIVSAFTANNPDLCVPFGGDDAILRTYASQIHDWEVE